MSLTGHVVELIDPHRAMEQYNGRRAVDMHCESFSLHTQVDEPERSPVIQKNQKMPQMEQAAVFCL